MRDRFGLVLWVAVVALAVGLAGGWWLRGDDTNVPLASSGDTPAVRVPGAELRAAERPRREDRQQPIGAQSVDGDDVPGEAPAESRLPARLAPPDSGAKASFSERPPDSDPQLRVESVEDLEDMDAEQRARHRSEDFDEFGDGPVARETAAEPAHTATGTRGDCLPLGARGCRRDVDCCGARVCRTRAGEIAGFRECSEAR